MKCIEVKENLSAFLDSEINFSTREKIDSHLGNCFSCQTELEKFQTISETMKQTMPIVAPTFLDDKVLGAFRSHHAEKEMSKDEAKLGWFGIPKLAFATAFLMLALFSGLAFQLGKMSVKNNQVSVPLDVGNKKKEFLAETNGKKTDREKASVNSDEKRLVETKIVEVPVIKEKIIKVPVIKEKIITRTVYVNKKQRRTRTKDQKVSKQETIALNNSIKDGEFLTQTNLEGFRPVSEIKPRVTKKEE